MNSMMKGDFYPCRGKIDEECLTIVGNSNILIEEGRTKIKFKNPKRKTLYKIKVDGCAIKEGKKCDYLLIYPQGKSFDEHFLELKGKTARLSRLMEQLENSIKILGCNGFRKRFAYAIFSNRAPRVTTQIQGFKRRFKEELRAHLLFKESKFEQDLEHPGET